MILQKIRYFHPPYTTFEYSPLHGSRNADDWQTNFDATLVAAKTECKLPLSKDIWVHRGFGHVVKSFIHNLENDLVEIIQKVSEGKENLDKEKLRILFTGHSHGAAVATLAAVCFADSQGQALFGIDYKNASGNQIQSYVFAMPRFVAQKDVSKVHEIFGRHNIIQQNVKGDPAPAILSSQLSDVTCLVQKALAHLSKVDLDRILGIGLSKMADSRFCVFKKKAAITLLHVIAHEFEKTQYESSTLVSLSFLVGLADPSLGRFIRGGISAEVLLAEQFRQRDSILKKVLNKKVEGSDQAFQPVTVAKDWSLERSLGKLYTGYGDVGYLASEQLAYEPVLTELVENFLIFLLNNIHSEDVTGRK